MITSNVTSQIAEGHSIGRIYLGNYYFMRRKRLSKNVPLQYVLLVNWEVEFTG